MSLVNQIPLYEDIPDNYEDYKKWINENMKNFIELFMKNTMNPKKDYVWLMNWIGKDCYVNFIEDKVDEECFRRKKFLMEQYVNKTESRPFFDSEQSNLLLEENEEPFVSRFSSTVPGDLTIQWWNDESKEAQARRFKYDTLEASDSKFNKQKIQEYVDYIEAKKAKFLKPKIIKRSTNQPYYIPSTQPYIS